MWRRVVRQMDTNVSQKRATSIFKVEENTENRGSRFVRSVGTYVPNGVISQNSI
jgi:hypothetical protein